MAGADTDGARNANGAEMVPAAAEFTGGREEQR